MISILTVGLLLITFIILPSSILLSVNITCFTMFSQDDDRPSTRASIGNDEHEEPSAVPKQKQAPDLDPKVFFNFMTGIKEKLREHSSILTSLIEENTNTFSEEPPSFKRMELGPSTNSCVASMKASTTASQNAQNQAAEAAKIATAETATFSAAETANSHALGYIGLGQ